MGKLSRAKARREEAKRNWDKIPPEDKRACYILLDRARAEARKKLDDPVWILTQERRYRSYGLDISL
jgi:hypothetical protein